MIKIKIIQSIAKDRQSVMKLLLDHDHLARFFDGKFKQTTPQQHGEPAGGQGSIREVTVHGQTFFEQIISANEQHICYRIIGKGPVSNHQGDILLFDNSDNTKIDYTIVCEPPWWQPNMLVKAIITRDIRLALKRLARHCDEC